jgi:CRP-like cAMP-binding protein
LFLPGQPVEAVYFPVGGLVSAFALADHDSRQFAVEVAAIGRDGMVGLALHPDANRLPFRVVCQIPGAAYRLPLPVFVELAESLPGFRSLLRRYTQFVLGRLAHLVACNLAHSVEQRCARWLLEVQDQVDEPAFRLTHEFLAEMLGARRSTVTAAVRRLADRGVIDYRWGRMTILDRAGLEAAGCSCYRRIRDEYERLLSS